MRRLSASDQAFEKHGLTLGDIPPGLGSVRSFARGSAVWTVGRALEAVHFLRRGQVFLLVEDERGRDVITRIVRPCEPFGITVFSDQRRQYATTSAIAAMRCEVLVIPLAAFRHFLLTNERAVAALLCTLSERLAYAEERIRILANHDAEDRLCALLQQLAMRGGRVSRRSRDLRALEFTHAELGELAGLSRAHVSLAMAKLRDKGLVEYSRNTPLLVNLPALADRRRRQSEAER
jgi:CRP/FNR family transcriptional regulator, cyclic AMP receptor protein